MAWVAVTNSTVWEYDNAPSDPGGAESKLWAKQTNGIRTNPSGREVYTNCRKVGSGDESRSNELSKTFYDALS